MPPASPLLENTLDCRRAGLITMRWIRGDTRDNRQETVPTYRLHDTTGDDLGTVEHPAGFHD